MNCVCHGCYVSYDRVSSELLTVVFVMVMSVMRVFVVPCR